MNAVGRDEHVLLKRFNRLVMLEFAAAIVGLCRGREDFHKHSWIQQRVQVSIHKAWLAAEYDYIGIRE